MYTPKERPDVAGKELKFDSVEVKIIMRVIKPV